MTYLNTMPIAMDVLDAWREAISQPCNDAPLTAQIYTGTIRGHAYQSVGPLDGQYLLQSH